MDSITTTVSVPAPDVPATINPNEEFTFSVTAANTAANTIRFVNVTYHLTISPSAVGQLKVPASPLIERVEAMPRNQSGADKSGRWIGSYADAKAWLSLVTPAPRT